MIIFPYNKPLKNNNNKKKFIINGSILTTSYILFISIE